MAERNAGPFREKSLERLSSPERLDQLLRIVDRKTWLPLATLALLVALLTAWSVVGQIPENVHGKGILVRPRGVVELQSPGAGYLADLNLHVGQFVAAGDVLGHIARPELEKQLELQREKARELATVPQISSRNLADRLKDKELQWLQQELNRLEEQERMATAVANSRQQRLQAHMQLHEQGVISREALVETESSYMDSLARASDLGAALRELRTRELQIEQDHMIRIEEIADREQEIADVRREIKRLEQLKEDEATIASEFHGEIMEVSTNVGEFLNRGDRLGSMTVEDPAGAFIGLIYFTVRDGKRVVPNMPIQVAPDSVERQRFGSIKGTVTSVSPLPVTLSEAEKVIGVREVAESLISGGYRMQVYATLQEDPETKSGLAWSSSNGPAMTLSAGTTATARVTVDKRPPISFVLPFLKSTVGID